MNPADLGNAIDSLLQEYRPESLVLAGQLANTLTTPWLQKNPHCVVTRIDPEADDLLSPDLRADFAVVSNTAGEFPARESQQMLARLRDLTVRQFAAVACVPAGPGWSRNELAAFALDHLGTFTLAEQQTETVDLYGYDIRRYKQTPDWLNADYWANPDRWNKERW